MIPYVIPHMTPFKEFRATANIFNMVKGHGSLLGNLLVILLGSL